MAKSKPLTNKSHARLLIILALFYQATALETEKKSGFNLPPNNQFSMVQQPLNGL